MYVTAIVLSMGTKFVNKEEIVSGTRSEDSVTHCVFPHCDCPWKMYSIRLLYLLLLFVKDASFTLSEESSILGVSIVAVECFFLWLLVLLYIGTKIF